MPPKRKAATILDESPAKRGTRPSAPPLTETQLSSSQPSTPITPRKTPIRTYAGRKRSQVHPQTELGELKENEARKLPPAYADKDSASADSSEDELNLSPSKAPKDTPGTLVDSGPVFDGIVIQKRGRRSHVDLPRKQSKRGLMREKVKRGDLDSSISSKERVGPTPTKNKADTRESEGNLPSLPRRTKRHLVNDISSRKQPKRARKSVKSPVQLFTDEQISTDEGLATHRELNAKSVHSSAMASPTKGKRVHHPDQDILSPRIQLKPTLPDDSDSDLFSEASSTLPTKELEFESIPASSVSRSASPASRPERIGHIPTSPPTTSPITSRDKRIIPRLLTHSPCLIPKHLHPCLNAQKRAILTALQNPSGLSCDGQDDEDEDINVTTNEVAFQQLTDLVKGTVSRGEGNSCLVLGPRGSGKTRLVERCISNLFERPIILRLSGWTQHSDRLAMREIAYQLNQQTGDSFLCEADHTFDSEDVHNPHMYEEPNPFLDSSNITASSGVPLLPSSHLPALISVLPTLSRPTVVILDGFDLFALHPRQSLLYCLLDTAQNCRANAGSKGLAVIGMTSRIDTINTLEKRVKSRFSGRMIRTAPPRKFENWTRYVRNALSSAIGHDEDDMAYEAGIAEEWNILWEEATKKFMGDPPVIKIFHETFSITQDIRALNRMLVSIILDLSLASPFPLSSKLLSAALTQRARPRFAHLHTLSYPALCLLIASYHTDTAGLPTFTFEMLHEYFRNQVHASTSAPVQFNGGSIGMMRCSRQVLISAFDHLVSMKLFVGVAALSSNIAKEFVKYRSVVEREDVKKAVEKTGHINLKKWLSKAQ